MDPSDLRELLAVLREAGATSATVPTADGPLVVALGPLFGPLPTETPAEPAPEDEDLPPGAFDPIKRRKQQLASAQPAPDDEGE